METKRKPAFTGTMENNMVHKYSDNSLIIKTIRGLFLSGRKLTAREINEYTHSNDARKVISTLRRQGLKIMDYSLPNRRKIYWLEPDKRQGELFEEGGEK